MEQILSQQGKAAISLLFFSPTKNGRSVRGDLISFPSPYYPLHRQHHHQHHHPIMLSIDVVNVIFTILIPISWREGIPLKHSFVQIALELIWRRNCTVLTNYSVFFWRQYFQFCKFCILYFQFCAVFCAAGSYLLKTTFAYKICFV